MKVKISAGDVEVRPLKGKDIAEVGFETLLKKPEKIAIRCVEKINEEAVNLNVFNISQWTERDLNKVVAAALKESKLDINAASDGELYTVLEKTDDFITVSFDGKTYKLKMLTVADTMSLPKSRNEGEQLLRKLSKSLVEVNGKKAKVNYEELLDWEAGILVALAGAYGELMNEGVDEVF